MIGMFLRAAIVFFTVGISAAGGYALESPLRCPPVPSDLAPFVQKVLASRPGDVFVVLRNGLTVLIREESSNDVVSCQVLVRAGSIYEGKRLSAGLSHYLEHVVAGGSTRSFSESDARERIQRMGGATNASTSYDRTVFYINTSGGRSRDALDLLLSYVSENVLDEREVAREKAVIQQEIKMGENNPSNELWKLFMRTAYRTSPVRVPVIGYEEVFLRQDREALAEYYGSRYQPQNTIVAVAGNVAPFETLKFICEKTKDFTRRSDELVTLPPEPVQPTSRWEEQTSGVARLTQAIVGFPSVTLQSADMTALDVLALILGEGESSRLYVRLKEKENLVLGVGAGNWTPSYVQGQFTVSLTLPPENWPGVLKSVEDEIDRVKKEPVTAEELNKAKNATIAQHVFYKETVSAQASSLASSYFDTGDPYFDDAYVDAVRRITAEDVRDVANRYLHAERMNVAVIQPRAVEEASDSTGGAKPAEARGMGVEFHRLQNGLGVLLKADRSLPAATIQLYGRGGLLMEDLRQPGVTSFTSSLLTAGTGKRSKSQIVHAIEDAGGAIESRSDNNTYHVSLRVLKGDLPMALDVLSDVVQNASFPPDEVEKKRRETLLAIQRQDENWQAEVGRLFRANYFRESPYRNDRLGTAESVQAFTREDIMGVYRRMVSPTHSVLAIYGDIDPAKVLDEIKEKFGAWPAGKAFPAAWREETRLIDADRVVEKKNEKTSAGLFVGANGLALEDSRRAVLDLLDAVLAGTRYPGGRLYTALRGGKEDLVYAIHAFPFYGEKAGYFGVITQTTMGNLDRVQGIILDNLRRLRDEPVPEDELENARDMLIAAHKLEAESLSAQAQRAVLNEVLGLGYSYDDKYLKEVQSVTAKEIQALAKELFSHTLVVRTLPEGK